MKDKVVVVTGASSGIGAALGELLGARGAKVVLVARREKELAEVAAKVGADAHVVVADVTKRGDVQRALDAAVTRFGHVDVWVNNAGRAISRPALALNDEDLDAMMLVNLKSALYGMQVAIAHFVARGSGQVINVSTMLSRVPFAPIRSAYSASKAALNSLTANIRMDLAKTHPGVHVTTVFPGVVATPFGENALHGGPDNRQLPGAQPVAEVAEVIADVIERPRAEVYTRAGMRETAAAYYAAEDVAAVEATFGAPRR